jgi:hypothetical protein
LQPTDDVRAGGASATYDQSFQALN